MDKFDRIFEIHKILSSRRTPIAREDLMARLECNRSSLYRLLALMRDRLNAPIKYDTERGGFYYAVDQSQPTYELPGLWFSSSELQALIVIQNLLNALSGGLLEDTLQPLARRLDSLVKHRRLQLGEATRRLRFPPILARHPGDAFKIVAAATLQRRKLWFEYHARSTDESSARTVSPQRITHYRESWYLDAWDDKRDALRTFSIDRIRRPTALDERALDIDDSELDEHYTTSYGIFGGKPDKMAVLKFSADRARWVADEQWHPQQIGTRMPDGSYELRVPYRESRELVMDVLRHGAGVEVLAPDELRAEVVKEVNKLAKLYRT